MWDYAEASGLRGGVVITASHNPIEYNGLKLLLGNSIAPKPLAEEIRSIYFDMGWNGPIRSAAVDAASDQTDEVHIEVMMIVEPELIRAKP